MALVLIVSHQLSREDYCVMGRNSSAIHARIWCLRRKLQLHTSGLGAATAQLVQPLQL